MLHIHIFFCLFLIWLIDAENVLVLSFEWMKANHRAAVEAIAKFAGYDLTPSVIDSIVDQTSFANMKTNPAANNSWMKPYFTDSSTDFMRKGKVGGWRDYFTDEQSARMDEKFKKQLEGTGLELHILNAYEQNIN